VGGKVGGGAGGRNDSGLYAHMNNKTIKKCVVFSFLTEKNDFYNWSHVMGWR
jgi:hypothetical protein